MIRFLDFLFSFLGLLLLSPVFLLVYIMIRVDSCGEAFYFQTRVGKAGRDFRLMKFRTMRINSDQLGGLTIGARDSRITRSGFLLRKYKLDELPQLINVLKGDMSLVGPRPEIRKYTDLYNEDQKIVLSVKPGITDYASIEYIDENEILGQSTDPEKTYIEVIMPAKIEINKRYINNRNPKEYLKILVITFLKLFR
ncbi:MAG: sugar transferase [Bacteroidetes bacterium]|nr:sugar transferase [Bacteroidota bacterium]